MNQSFINQLKEVSLPQPEVDWKELWIEMGRAEERKLADIKLRKQRLVMGSYASFATLAACLMLGLWMNVSSLGNNSSETPINLASTELDQSAAANANQSEGNTHAEGGRTQQDDQHFPLADGAQPDGIRDGNGDLRALDNSLVTTQEGLQGFPVSLLETSFSSTWRAPDWLRRKRVLERAANGELGEIKKLIPPSESLQPIFSQPLTRPYAPGTRRLDGQFNGRSNELPDQRGRDVPGDQGLPKGRFNNDASLTSQVL